MDTSGSIDYQDRKLKERRQWSGCYWLLFVWLLSDILSLLKLRTIPAWGIAEPWLDWSPLLCRKKLEGTGVRSIFENSRVNLDHR